MLSETLSNGAYDTTPYHATIGIFYFDVFNKPQKAQETALFKGVSMDTAKREAHQRAVKLGYTAKSAWQEACSNDSTREYHTNKGARRLVVVERV